LIISFFHLASSSSSLPSPIIGYYSWTWQGSYGPPNANVEVVFSGGESVSSVISSWESSSAASIHTSSNVQKWITLGGGSTKWSSSYIQKLINNKSQFHDASSKGFSGILFDIEIVTEASSTLIPLLTSLFSAVKSEGMIAGVSIPYWAHDHLYPDHGSDSVAYVKFFLSSASGLDVVSPQMYETGHEQYPILTQTPEWKDWSGSSAKIIPSVVRHTQYPSVSYFFNLYGVHTDGFLAWEQYGTHSGKQSHGLFYDKQKYANYYRARREVELP